jgi:hypothetical protein
LRKFVNNIEVKFKNRKSDRWDASVNEKIPSLLAWIFSLWTLSDSRHFYDNENADNQEMYLLRSHPAQRVFSNGDDIRLIFPICRFNYNLLII